MGTYNGDNGNNYKAAVQEWDDGSWWNPFDGKWVWNSWTMNGKAGNDTLIGGSKNDTLHGNEGNDSLEGGGGDDYLYGDNDDDSLYGGSGKDVLYGGNGYDLLDGGSGNDSMYGGDGDDAYYVDSTSDLVVEYFNQGLDVVFSSVSYSLGDNLEYLVLQDNTSAINGYGNELDNLIFAFGSVNNYLYGGGGNDSLSGYGGNDSLYGGGGNDSLYGGADNDILNGYGYTSFEYDTLTGGSGTDIFVLGSSSQAFYLGSGYATITDFNWGENDKFQVHGTINDYSLGTGNWSGSSDLLDTEIYYQGDLIAVVQDKSGSDVLLNWDFNFVT